jgi:PilZ domain-containing protein
MDVYALHRCSQFTRDSSSGLVEPIPGKMRRLREFNLVVLNPPWRGALRADCFDCHVLAVIGNTAAIEPVDLAATLWLPDKLESALLSFRHEGSLVGLCGTLYRREDVGDLRYTVTDGIQAPGRRATRIDVRAPITVRLAGAANPVEGMTVNLSAYGLLVDCELDAAPGDAVEFSLTLPGVDEPLEAAATVARLVDGGIGLDIDAGNRSVRSRLAGFVVDHNRARLRRRQPKAELELDF